MSSALSSACDFKSHFCKQSDQGPHCLPVCKNRFEKSARIFSRRHKQKTFSDALFPGALRVKDVKFTENVYPPKFDFNAEIQNFTEYFYRLSFNFNTDFQKINAEIPFTRSYLELWWNHMLCVVIRSTSAEALLMSIHNIHVYVFMKKQKLISSGAEVITDTLCSAQTILSVSLPYQVHNLIRVYTTGPEVIKLFSCSSQLSMKCFKLINLKLLTMPNTFLLNIAEYENFSTYIYEMQTIIGIFIIRENFMLSWVEHEKSFTTSGPCLLLTCK